MSRWGARAAFGVRRQNAQALAEFGLVLPLFLTVMMVAIQLSILFLAQLSVMWVAGTVVRHVATGSPSNYRFADSCQTTYRDAQLPAVLVAANFQPMIFTPAYTPGSSDCTTVTGNIPATTRQHGSALQVTLQYRPTNLLFLPSTFFGVPILQTLPVYTATAMME